MLLYGDESEALTHPYLARAWAERGADLRVPAPAKKVAMMGSLDHLLHRLIVQRRCDQESLVDHRKSRNTRARLPPVVSESRRASANAAARRASRRALWAKPKT